MLTFYLVNHTDEFWNHLTSQAPENRVIALYYHNRPKSSIFDPGAIGSKGKKLEANKNM
jgi:hypothetical protein